MLEIEKNKTADGNVATSQPRPVDCEITPSDTNDCKENFFLIVKQENGITTKALGTGRRNYRCVKCVYQHQHCQSSL